MNRYNIFNQIHKGLRALLYETAASIQQTDFISKEESADVLTRIEEIIELFDGHADTEDSMVLPAIATYEPAVVNVFAEEHVEDHRLAQALKELVMVFRISEKEETRIQTGRAINIAFTEFLVFNLNHMAKEERVLNNLLWRYYKDEDLQELTQKIVAKQKPEQLAKASKWMMRGLNNREIIGWLLQVKATAPEFVFKGLAMMAEKEVSVNRWKFIHEKTADIKAVA